MVGRRRVGLWADYEGMRGPVSGASQGVVIDACDLLIGCAKPGCLPVMGGAGPAANRAAAHWSVTVCDPGGQ